MFGRNPSEAEISATRVFARVVGRWSAVALLIGGLSFVLAAAVPSTLVASSPIIFGLHVLGKVALTAGGTLVVPAAALFLWARQYSK